jgi:dTDP-4-dehydrorhamnose 3,5-epimerase
VIFSETRISGVYTIDLRRREDDRGFFARTYCDQEFTAHGLKRTVAQASVSFNARRGTLRGLHFQYPPVSETKYVRCTRGGIFDVVVDLRPESGTYMQYLAFHLSAANGRGVYVPERFAHGFITLEDETEVAYMMSEAYTPGAEGGLPYDDPGLAIDWPMAVEMISKRDTMWKPLAAVHAELKSRMSAAQHACPV